MTVEAPKHSAAEPQAANSARGSLFGEMLDWMVAPFFLISPFIVMLIFLISGALANDVFDTNLASRMRAFAEQARWETTKNGLHLVAAPGILQDDIDGDTPLYRIDSAKGELLVGEPELPTLPADALQKIGTVTFRTIHFRESSARIATLRYAPKPSQHQADSQTIIVTVVESTDKRAALTREMMKGILIPQLLLVPLMVFLMWVGLKRGAAPLARLSAKLVAREATDRRPLTVTDAPEEVAPLINAFNDLLARAAHEGAAQKRFIANAAHQLRTPLAGIKMQAELALRNTGTGQKTEALTKIADGTVRTSRLINQLLALARAEAATHALQPAEALDFADIARAATQAAYPLASAKQIELGFDAVGPVMVYGHADLLRELVNNLVENAIAYTPAHGHISVRVLADPAPTLLVEDDGVGIAEAERELVFERFYRVLGGQAPGSGIGLAIVKEIANQHQASVAVTTPASGIGSIFRVVFARPSGLD